MTRVAHRLGDGVDGDAGRSGRVVEGDDGAVGRDGTGDGEGYAEHGAVGLFGLRGEIVDRRTHPLVVGVGVGIGERAREGGDGAPLQVDGA